MTRGCVELHSRRLRLLPLGAHDAEDIHALSRLPDVMRYTSMPALTREGSDAFLARSLAGMRDGSIIAWSIRSLEGGFLGQAAVFGIEAKNHQGEIGYMLMPEAWGKGYASEVVAQLIRFAFGYRKLARLNAQIDPANQASGRILEKHGFVREGARRASGYKEGAFYDSILYGLLNEKRIAELSQAT